MHVGILILHGSTRSGPPCSVIGLHPGNVSREVLVGEIPTQVPTFLNWFVKTGGNYPAADFRTVGGCVPPSRRGGAGVHCTC